MKTSSKLWYSLIWLLCGFSMGCGFTKMTHPDVEVLDQDSKQFFVEKVTVLSRCGSCHDNVTDKYVVYSNTVKNKNSLDKIDLVKSHAFRGAEMSGYDNYAESEFGFFYYYPWWYDNYVVGSGLYGDNQFVSVNEQVTDEKRRRQSYRRGSGRLRLSSPGTTYGSMISVPPLSTGSSVGTQTGTLNSPSSTVNSGDNATQDTRRKTENDPVGDSRRDSAANETQNNTSDNPKEGTVPSNNNPTNSNNRPTTQPDTRSSGRSR